MTGTKKLGIVGSAFSGGAIQIIDILISDKQDCEIRVYDDNDSHKGKNIFGISVVGKIDQMAHDYRFGKINTAVIAVGSIEPRTKLYFKIKDFGIPICNIISSKADISFSAKMGEGNVLLPYVYLGPNTVIKNNNYLTTGTQINHDSVLGSHCYFSAAVVVAGRVCVGDRVRADTAASITADTTVQDDAVLLPNTSFGQVRGK